MASLKMMEPVSFRRRVARWSVVLLATGFFIIPFSGVFVTGTDAAPSVAQRVICSVAATMLLWLMVGIARSGIFAGPDGVTFRNYFRTHHFHWEDIDHFGRPSRYGAMRNAGLRACLRGGQVVTSSLYVAGPFNRPTFADPVVEALNDLLARRTGRDGAPSPATIADVQNPPSASQRQVRREASVVVTVGVPWTIVAYYFNGRHMSSVALPMVIAAAVTLTLFPRRWRRLTRDAD